MDPKASAVGDSTHASRAALAIAGRNDWLPSWREGDARDGILQFVARVTTSGGPDFVPVRRRIAVFDNDGTLWSEQPVYVQLAFAIDRIRALAPQHPEWRTEEPFASLLQGDVSRALAGGEHAVVALMMATHAGMTTDEFDQLVRNWIGSAQHPGTYKPYTRMIYQPMLEVLGFLRANGFRTYIVSGGGVDFMRPWTETTYGIPPEQVIGSSIKTRFEMRNGKPVLVRLPEVDFIDDKAGKPVGIARFTGGRPIFAFGNSDGDQQMLEWTAANGRVTFVGLVHHTDAIREWAYDRGSPIGGLNTALDEANANDWTVVSMKDDWSRIHPT